MVTPAERRRADLFFESLVGGRARAEAPHFPGDERVLPEDEQSTPAPAQQPYLPPGGRNFAPQNGVFKCAPNPFVVVPASFLAERTTDANAAIDAALTAAKLDAAQRRLVTRTGLVPIATEFGPSALRELFARLRWSADDIVRWGQGAGSMLVPRLLIHIPGHFRELARRAPDGREAFVLRVHRLAADGAASRNGRERHPETVWVPPPPAWVTAVPNPIPPLTAEVSRLLTRFLLIDTTMTADQWNARLVAWGGGLAGRQWQAEVLAPQRGRPGATRASATIPAHVSTTAVPGHPNGVGQPALRPMPAISRTRPARRR